MLTAPAVCQNRFLASAPPDRVTLIANDLSVEARAI